MSSHNTTTMLEPQQRVLAWRVPPAGGVLAWASAGLLHLPYLSVMIISVPKATVCACWPASPSLMMPHSSSTFISSFCFSVCFSPVQDTKKDVDCCCHELRFVLVRQGVCSYFFIHLLSIEFLFIHNKDKAVPCVW